MRSHNTWVGIQGTLFDLTYQIPGVVKAPGAPPNELHRIGWLVVQRRIVVAGRRLVVRFYFVVSATGSQGTSPLGNTSCHSINWGGHVLGHFSGDETANFLEHVVSSVD